MTDQSINQPCDLKRVREMVALLEAQLKEMNPNLDSIAEYVVFVIFLLMEINLVIFGPTVTRC